MNRQETNTKYAKILLVAPFPPPLTGNSLPVKRLYDNLKDKHEIEIINLNKDKHEAGVSSFNRILKILSVLWKVWLKQKHYDVVYLTVAESLAGNLRDIIFYFICRNRLDTVVTHMLGGAAMANILSPDNGFQFRANRKYISQLGGVIVEGQAQHDTFSNVIDSDKIHIIHNFAEEFLFVTEEEVSENFKSIDPLRILFLSNMLSGKGHMELMKSYFELDKSYQEKIKIDFAGKLVYESEKEAITKGVNSSDNLHYHGSVSGDFKKGLYANAHVFCLPTYYPYEGQPFCIVEAYATGCMVVTTNHSGIRYVFKDEVNGFEVEKKSIPALTLMLKRLVDERDQIEKFALANVKLAKTKYTTAKYLDAVKSVFSKTTTLKIKE